MDHVTMNERALLGFLGASTRVSVGLAVAPQGGTTYLEMESLYVPRFSGEWYV